MPTIREADHITLSVSEIREELKALEARAKLLRKKLEIAEQAHRVEQALCATSRASTAPRRNPTPLPVGPPNTNGLRDAIRATKGATARFTVEKMHEQLHDFSFGSGADPVKAIRDALYVLVKKRELRIVTKGKGGRPNVYEWQAASKPAMEAAS